MSKSPPVNRLKLAREKAKLSQTALAAQSGYNQALISRIENNRYAGSVKQIQTFARILNVSPSYLLGDLTDEEEEMYENKTARERILTFKGFPKGLRTLDEAQTLVDALDISDDEFESLLSIRSNSRIDKNGYIQLLTTLRSFN